MGYISALTYYLLLIITTVMRMLLRVSLCLSVCLSASISPELRVRSWPNFVHVTFMAVARSSSGGVAICYVLPVLRMTLRLHNNMAKNRPCKKAIVFFCDSVEAAWI